MKGNKSSEFSDNNITINLPNANRKGVAGSRLGNQYIIDMDIDFFFNMCYKLSGYAIIWLNWPFFCQIVQNKTPQNCNTTPSILKDKFGKY